MPQPPTPPPRKRQVLTFVSPKVADIIFYELRDSRVPSYRNPPEFGTAHPQTKKYPNHKLVFVVPAGGEEDGWQRWYYAAARESQDDYNFERDGNSHVLRTYIIPRSEYLDEDYSPPAKGDPDPTFAGYTYVGEETVRRTNDEMLDSYFVVVQRAYANITEVIAASEEGTARGEEGSETTLGIESKAVAIGPGLILQRSSRLSEYDLWHNTENRLALRSGVNTYTVSNRPGFSEVETSELSMTEPVAGTGEISFSKRLVTTDVEGQNAIWSANRSTRTSSPANGSELTYFLGGGIADIDISLVADTTSADSGFYIIASEVRPLGNGEGVRTTKTIDNYPVLVDTVYDASLDALVTTTKTVCAPGSTSASYNPVSGDLVEVRSVDKWRSLCITTSVGAGATRTETLPGIFNYRFPPTLRSATFLGAYAWAINEVNFDWDLDFSLVFDVCEAFAGAFEGRVVRIVTRDPEGAASSYTPTLFRPTSHTIGLATAAAYASPQTVWAKTASRTWQTPLALNGGITIQIPEFIDATGGENITVDAEFSNMLPATSPPAIPSAGDWLTIGMSTRRLKYGFYEVLVRQIKSPGPC